MLTHPFRCIPEDGIRDAAIHRYALCRQTSVSAIAKKIGVPRRTLSDHLDRQPELRQRFRIVKNSGTSFKTPELYAAYERAAKAITKNKNDLPSPSNLARHMEIRRTQVIRYLREHQDLAARIGLVSDMEARVYREGKKMIAEGIPVLRADLAAHAKIHYITLVNRVLKANPSFVTDLQIVWDSRKNKVWNAIHRPKNPRVRNRKRST